MSVALIARKKMMYALQGYVQGEAFDARDEADASLLVKLGLASLAKVQHKVMEPEPEPVHGSLHGYNPVIVGGVISEPTEIELPETAVNEGSPSISEPRKRRTYRRRDMRPESE